MPTRCHLIQFLKTGTQPTETILAICSSLKIIQGFFNDRINLDDILLHITLRNFKQTSFGLLHQIIHIHGFIKSLLSNFGRKRNKLPCQIFLCNDACVIFDMRCRCYFFGQFSYIYRASNRIQLTPSFQFFNHSEHVNGFLLNGQVLNSSKNHLMRRIIKTLGLKYITNDKISIFFEHQRA